MPYHMHATAPCAGPRETRVFVIQSRSIRHPLHSSMPGHACVSGTGPDPELHIATRLVIDDSRGRRGGGAEACDALSSILGGNLGSQKNLFPLAVKVCFGAQVGNYVIMTCSTRKPKRI
jgi:hypothetical protein